MHESDNRPPTSPRPSLQSMADHVARVDPLSGPNVMRYGAQVFKDNGDGTMTMRRYSQYTQKTGE